MQTPPGEGVAVSGIEQHPPQFHACQAPTQIVLRLVAGGGQGLPQLGPQPVDEFGLGRGERARGGGAEANPDDRHQDDNQQNQQPDHGGGRRED